ncbi:MAG: hypothetical protein E5Y60_04395 [Mesorhizobium sp.]|nr:MAG: hypothetical protein E5Y60_04395 [Mesorhizobium sp.]
MSMKLNAAQNLPNRAVEVGCSCLARDPGRRASHVQREAVRALRSSILSLDQAGLLIEIEYDRTRSGIFLPVILKRLWSKAVHQMRLALMFARDDADESLALFAATQPAPP